jgi:hypothetical protein
MNNFINPRPFENPATKHGLKFEAEARTVFEVVHKVKVFQVELVVDQSRPWLAASPDGVIINTDGTPETLLEIKCPHLGKNAVFLNKYHCNIFCFIGRSMSIAEIPEKKMPTVHKETNKWRLYFEKETYVLCPSTNEFIYFRFENLQFHVVLLCR